VIFNEELKVHLGSCSV